MNQKQRVLAALAGQAVDRNPVTALYHMLYFQDHFAELTGLPAWKMHAWHYATPREHLDLYCQMVAAAPFEILQPDSGPSPEEQQRTEIIEKDGLPFRRDTQDGSLVPLASASGHPIDYTASQEQLVFSKADIREQVKVVPAEEQIRSGLNERVEAIVSTLGKDHYILSGGVVGTIYSCGWYVGQANALAMLKHEPELMETLCSRITEQNIETIRTLAAAGGDAIYIDDATATSDMISPKDYERFSLPYMKMMVAEIHRLDHQAIVIYFGGVMDRLEAIVETGADGFSMETTMKAFVNDIDEIARRIGRKITLFGNLDPLGVLQDGTDDELQAEMQRQAEAGRQARGFIHCTGSPITPGTPLSRVRRFLDLGKSALMPQRAMSPHIERHPRQ